MQVSKIVPPLKFPGRHQPEGRLRRHALSYKLSEQTLQNVTNIINVTHAFKPGLPVTFTNDYRLFLKAIFNYYIKWKQKIIYIFRKSNII